MSKRSTRSRKYIMNKDMFDLGVCSQRFYDINNTISSYDPSTFSSTTSHSSPIPNSHFSAQIAMIIGGSMGGVFLIFMIIISCLVSSKRSEKRKRSAIEEQYRVVASTLTNITDSEDGCTYESLSMNDPTYRSNVAAPTRKPKSGITNGLAVFKRWASFDENEMKGNDKTLPPVVTTATQKRSHPLPAIPEPVGSRHLMEQIDAYTEVGVEEKNMYNTLEASPYEILRESQLIRDDSVKSTSKTGISGGYFTLEKTITDNQTSTPGGEYFILDNNTDKPTEPRDIPSGGLQKNPTCNVVRKSKQVTNDLNPKTLLPNNIVNEPNPETDIPKDNVDDHTSKTVTVTDVSVSENANTAESEKCETKSQDVPANTYFTLENTLTPGALNVFNGKIGNRSSDYLEPIPRERNVYLDVNPVNEITKL